ncbi:hypothetical protein FRC01_014549, partial [Tulasnella sp. 417]
MIGLSLYIAILILMLVGKQAEIRPRDGVCVIGLSRFSSIPLLTFDLIITLALTSLFVRPLWKGKFPTIKLRNLAIKTVVSSGVALGTSAVNIAILTVLHGKELGWVCLTSCGGDVTINALVLYIVTSGSQIQETNPNPENKPSATTSATTPQPINDRKLLMNDLRKHGLANNPLSPTESLKAGRSPSISSASVPPPVPTPHVHFKDSNGGGAWDKSSSSESDLVIKSDPLGVEGGGIGDRQVPVLRTMPNRPRLGSFSTTDSESKSPAMGTPSSSGMVAFNSTSSRSDSQANLNSSFAGGERPAKGVRNSLSAAASRASAGARNIFRNVGEVLWGSHAQPEAASVQ